MPLTLEVIFFVLMRGFKRILFLSSLARVVQRKFSVDIEGYYSSSSAKFPPEQQRTGLKLNYASLNIDRVEHFV